MNIDIPHNAGAFSDDQFASIKTEIQTRLKSDAIRKPIFNHDLSAEEWKLVAEYAEKLNADYDRRAQLSLKRIDATVDAFLWSDRVKKLEEKILEKYSPAREALSCPPPVGIEDLLSATTDLLLIQKASSQQVRLATCNDFCAYTLKDMPKDRGGRTAEMVAPPPDAPYWKQQKQQQQQQQHHHQQLRQHQNNQRGGRNGGGFFQQYRGQREDHVENQVRQQYNPQRGGGGGGYRGRGGGPRGGGNQGGAKHFFN